MVPAPRSRSLSPATFLLGAAIAAAVPADAAPADLSANVAVVSDYRFRGLSLSHRRPALQGGVDLAVAGGWYVGGWGSTIAPYGGSRVEVDMYGGRSGHLAGMGYSISAAVYLYPSGRRLNYGEARIELSRNIGPVTLAVEGDYVPAQANTGIANLYLGAQSTVALAGSPLSLTLRGGYENGFYVRKLDWEAGLAARLDHVSASVSLIGSAGGGLDGETTGDAPATGRRAGRTGMRLAITTTF